MENNLEDQISLYEVLVKTSYHTQITEPDDKDCKNPIGFGSGFMVLYNNNPFFVTADHNVHFDDYKEEKEQRTGKDYVVSIFNNYSSPENFLSTAVTPLGGFYYAEQFHLDKPINTSTLLDVSVCKMDEKHFEQPFLTDEVNFQNDITIKAREQKFYIKEECFNEPTIEKCYFIFGKIRTKLIDNIRLERVNTLKGELRFVAKSGDYFLFNTPNMITDKEDWEGLSGSPVISEDGECVGVLCDVLGQSHSIWVMPIAKVKMLIEVAIQQEKLNS